LCATRESSWEPGMSMAKVLGSARPLRRLRSLRQSMIVARWRCTASESRGKNSTNHPTGITTTTSTNTLVDFEKMTTSFAWRLTHGLRISCRHSCSGHSPPIMWRIHTIEIPGSRNQGMSPCPRGTHPMAKSEASRIESTSLQILNSHGAYGQEVARG